jgi:hypothetical protein
VDSLGPVVHRGLAAESHTRFLLRYQREPRAIKVKGGINNTMTTRCSHHCRECGDCFTSLRVFDLHRVGPWSDRRCDLAGVELVERTGGCKIANPELPVAGVTVYERPDTAEYRKRMNATLTGSRKLSGVANWTALVADAAATAHACGTLDVR